MSKQTKNETILKVEETSEYFSSESRGKDGYAMDHLWAWPMDENIAKLPKQSPRSTNDLIPISYQMKDAPDLIQPRISQTAHVDTVQTFSI